MDRLLGFDAQLLFDAAVTGVNVLVLFAILTHFFFRPVREFLGKRRELLQSEMDGAATLRKDAVSLKNLYENKILEASKEAESILQEADQKAKFNRRRILEDARKEAEQILEQAEKELEQKRLKAEDEMKREIVSVAAVMAAQAVKGLVDKRMQEALIEKTLKEMDEITWQA